MPRAESTHQRADAAKAALVRNQGQRIGGAAQHQARQFEPAFGHVAAHAVAGGGSEAARQRALAHMRGFGQRRQVGHLRQAAFDHLLRGQHRHIAVLLELCAPHTQLLVRGQRLGGRVPQEPSRGVPPEEALDKMRADLHRRIDAAGADDLVADHDAATRREADFREALVRRGDRPLSLYAFGLSSAEQQRVLRETHAGGVTLNDWGWHVFQHDLPFGGTGNSGMGTYHGEEGFRELSHAKSVFKRHRWFPIGLFYPPYGNLVQRLSMWLYLGKSD